MDLMLADTWNRTTGEKDDESYFNGLNLLHSDGSLELLEEYTITSEAIWEDYSCRWTINETSKSIDLLVIPVFEDQVMRVLEEFPLLQQIFELLFSGACLWEGLCTVSGTINGILVEGNAYVELTHRYDN
jgi:hypothetical protein